MNKLEEARILIDEIDSQIIDLFEKRMNAIIEVIKYKIANNMPVLDSSREVIMYEKNLKKIKNEQFKQYYKSVLDGFLKASKDMQHDILNNVK